MKNQEKPPRICFDWLRNGGCTRKDCKFAHEKTEPCADYSMGKCKYGKECLYIHVAPKEPAKVAPPKITARGWLTCEQDDTTRRFEYMEQKISSTKRKYVSLKSDIDVLTTEVEQMQLKISTRMSTYAQLEKVGEQIQQDRLRLEQEEKSFKKRLVDFQKEYHEIAQLTSKVESHKKLINTKTSELQNIVNLNSGTNNNVATIDHEDDKLCAICMDSGITHVLVPCGHAKFCSSCVQDIKECPVCRKEVTMCMKLYS